jgi:hypothetical protein
MATGYSSGLGSPGTGRTAERPEMELAHVVTLEGERTRRIEEFFDRSEALQACGLQTK